MMSREDRLAQEIVQARVISLKLRVVSFPASVIDSKRVVGRCLDGS